jgi:hypothetical protein
LVQTELAPLLELKAMICTNRAVRINPFPAPLAANGQEKRLDKGEMGVEISVKVTGK